MKTIRRVSNPASEKGIKSKAKKWLRRFLPAELVGTLIAVACVYASMKFTNERLTIAYAASIAETVGFYLTILITDALLERKKLKKENRTLTWNRLLPIVKELVIDFGIAELVDSLLIRPLFMYLFPLWLRNYALGVVVGKLASDLAFYIPVTISAEIRRHLARRRGRQP